MRKIDAALFLINFDTMEVLWSTIKDPDIIEYWYGEMAKDRHLASYDGQKDNADFGNNAYYVYVKL